MPIPGIIRHFGNSCGCDVIRKAWRLIFGEGKAFPCAAICKANTPLPFLIAALISEFSDIAQCGVFFSVY